MFKLVEADQEMLRRWDDLLMSSPQNSIFLQLSWLRFIEKNLQCEMHPLCFYSANTLVALCPLFVQKKYMFNIISSPALGSLTPHGGPIFLFDHHKQHKKEYIFKEFLEYMNHFIRKKNGVFVYISNSIDLLDARPYIWAGYRVMPTYTYVIDLRRSAEELWKDLKRGKRKNIRRVDSKFGIKIREGSRQDVRRVFNIVSSRYREQGETLPVTRQFLDKAYETFYPEHLRVFVAEHNNEVAAAQIILTDKDYVYMWIGGTSRKIKEAFDVLIWSIIKWARDKGYAKLDMLGANVPNISMYKASYNPGLYLNFVATKWNSRPLKWIYKISKISTALRGREEKTVFSEVFG